MIVSSASAVCLFLTFRTTDTDTGICVCICVPARVGHSKRRGFSVSTICGHITSFLACGHAYEWSRFGVDDWRYRMVDTVCELKANNRLPPLPAEVESKIKRIALPDTATGIALHGMGELKAHLPAEITYDTLRWVMVHRYRLRWLHEEERQQTTLLRSSKTSAGAAAVVGGGGGGGGSDSRMRD